MTGEARVKVACINWGVPDRPGHPPAPRGLTYVLRDGEAVAERFCDTWREALDRGNELARRLDRLRVQREEVMTMPSGENFCGSCGGRISETGECRCS